MTRFNYMVLFKLIIIAAFTCFLSSSLAAADLLDAYANATGKTLLISSSLHRMMTPDLPADKTNAIEIIEKEFSSQGIAVLHDGPHFIIVVPQRQRESLTNVLKLRGEELASADAQKSARLGAMDFSNIDPETVVEFYARLSGRTVLRRMLPPASLIRLKATSSLSRDEAIYAIAT